MSHEATRRDAVRRGLIAGGAAISAGMIPSLFRARGAFAQEADISSGDAGIIEGVLNLEQAAVLLYRTGAQSGLLGPRAPVADLFGRQEQEHADVLTKLLKDLGGQIPTPPRPEDIAGLSEVKTEKGFLAFAIELENMAIAAYADAVMNLTDPALMTPVTQIMANEGQHLVVLRQALGTGPVPSATPTGLEKG